MGYPWIGLISLIDGLEFGEVLWPTAFVFSFLLAALFRGGDGC